MRANTTEEQNLNDNKTKSDTNGAVVDSPKKKPKNIGEEEKIVPMDKINEDCMEENSEVP